MIVRIDSLASHGGLLTNFLVHRPHWDADSRSCGQEIPRPYGT